MSDPPFPDCPTDESPPRKCARCGNPLPPDHPSELCPTCLLQPPPEQGFGAAWTVGPGQRWQPPATAELAEHFPHLAIEELLGRGGMGAVYRARQKSLDRPVALKILPPEIASRPGFADRFAREAQALARLSHPNIVTVFDFGQSGPYAFLVMEHIDGVNLRQVLSDGHLTPEEALGIVPQLCDALQFAHGYGVVHRDIKPENILLDTRGHVKIADFGLAKLAGETGDRLDLTGTATVVGTMYYMAPEQVEHPGRVDHRADIYSLGVVFYEMLTGELPLGRFQPPSQRVQVDVRLDKVVLRTLEKEPELRYGSAGEVKTDVHEIETSSGASAPNAERSETEGAGEGFANRVEHYGRLALGRLASAARDARREAELRWRRANFRHPEVLGLAALLVQVFFLLIASAMRAEEMLVILAFAGVISLSLARLGIHLAGPASLSKPRWWLIGLPLAIVYIPVILVALGWPLIFGVVLTEVFYDSAEPPAVERVFAMVVFGTMLAYACWWFMLSFLAWIFPDTTRFLFRPFADAADGSVAKWLALVCLTTASVAIIALMYIVSIPV